MFSLNHNILIVFQFLIILISCNPGTARIDFGVQDTTLNSVTNNYPQTTQTSSFSTSQNFQPSTTISSTSFTSSSTPTIEPTPEETPIPTPTPRIYPNAICDENCINEPPCCKEIRDNEDPYKCEWPTRGWCNNETCAPFAGKGSKCGWYWRFHDAGDGDLGTNTERGYGCMIGETEETMQPACNSK